MIVQLLSAYQSVLYFCCMLLISRYILGYAHKWGWGIISVLPIVVLLVSACLADSGLYNMVYTVFAAAQFVIIKLCYRGVRIRSVIAVYALLYSFNLLLVSLLVAVWPGGNIIFDLLVSSILGGACIAMCTPKLRAWVQDILELSPKYVKRLLLVFLIVAAILSTYVMGQEHVSHSGLNHLVRVFMGAFMLLTLAALPTFMLISISNTRLKTMTVDYERQIRVQAEHYKALAYANYEVRRFRHDFANIRVAVEQLVSQGDHEEAIRTLRQCSAVMDSHAGLGAFDTGNGIADALLADKQERAASCNARICFHGALPARSIDPIDLCVLLGNTVDNAIEACEKMKTDSEKIISVRSNCNSGFLFLTVVNPVNGKAAVRNGQIATTKENKTLHGFGLYSLKAVVKKYDGELKLHSEEDTFTAEISLCLNNSVGEMQ